MGKVATDIYTFARLREEGFTYVDKTAILHEIASGENGAQFFIARPRGFGKSLAVSTLKSLFEARRDLFLGRLIPAYIGLEESYAVSAHFKAAKALYAHDVPKLLKALKAFFVNIPYDMTDRQNEQMWQTIVYVVLRSIGVNVNGEVKTHDGRIDMVAEVPGEIYIIEFKLDRPASEAMEQIKGKDYAGKYALSRKRITIIGISFSSEKRTIVEELVDELGVAG